MESARKNVQVANCMTIEGSTDMRYKGLHAAETDTIQFAIRSYYLDLDPIDITSGLGWVKSKVGSDVIYIVI